MLRLFALMTGLAVIQAALPGSHPQVNLSIAERDFVMEVASTPALRFQGLSGRHDIAESAGMLFSYPDARVRHFVMRGCRVPIDLIFLNDDGVILAAHEMPVEDPEGQLSERRLSRYSSGAPARYALEFRGGTIAELGLQPGQRVVLPSLSVPSGTGQDTIHNKH